MSNLTKNQESILNYIDVYIKSKGYSPTKNEIAAKMDKHKATIAQHLKVLERKGLITMEFGKSRTIVVI